MVEISHEKDHSVSHESVTDGQKLGYLRGFLVGHVGQEQGPDVVLQGDGRQRIQATRYSTAAETIALLGKKR